MKIKTKIYSVRKSYVIILTLIFICHIVNALRINADYKVPDFAYPKTVQSQSDSMLNISLQKGDDLMALRCVINSTLATNILSENDNQRANINLLDSVISRISPLYQAIGYLLRADLIKDEYLQKKNIYDERKIPEDQQVTSNISEWNGDMFKSAIIASVDSAAERINFCQDFRIDKIKILLSNIDTSECLEMNVADFILLKSIKILNSIGDSNSETIIPFFPSNVESMTTHSEKANLLAKHLCLNLIDINKDNSNLKAIGVVEYERFLNQDQVLNYLVSELDGFENTPGEGIILNELWQRGRYETQISKQTLYKKITEFLKNFPKSYSSSSLEYVKSVLNREEIAVEIPNLILPDSSFTAKVRVENIEKGFILIYKLNNDEYDFYDGLILKKITSTKKPVRIYEVDGFGEIPFSVEKEIKISGLSQGVYAAIPSKNKNLAKGWTKASEYSSYSTFRVTDISIISSYDTNEKKSGKIYVVRAQDQIPLSGAKVRLYEGDKKAAKYVLLTDKDGSVELPTGYFRIEAEFGRSIAKSEMGYGFYPQSNKSTAYTSILTDLSVYRPGDTVSFVVVGWVQSERNNHLLNDSTVSVTLRDVNYNKVDEISLKFDKLGRCIGKMKIPEGKLTGIYRLTTELCGMKAAGGSAEFLVSEYKLPLFSVTIEKDSVSNIPRSDTLRFKGIAMTYSKMPVSNANVNIKVEYLPWFGMRSMYSPASYYYNTVTDGNGEFTMLLPVNNLKDTRFERGKYRVTANVTADDGDSETSAPLYFYLGNQNTIMPNIPEKIEIRGDSVCFNVPVYDMMGLPVKIPLKYRIYEEGNEENTINGEFISPNLEIVSSDFKSGKYKLEFYSESDKKDKIACESVIFRENDEYVPYETPLWIPVNEYVYNSSDNFIDVKFGSYWEGSSLLFILSDRKGIIKREWIKADSCLNHIDIKNTGKNEELFITLSGMHDFETKIETIKLIPAESLKKMEVSVNSFRENITAGDEEHWSFKFSFGNENQGVIPAMAVLSDKALNAINGFKWNMDVPKFHGFNTTHIRQQNYGLRTTDRYFTSISTRNWNNSIIPDWETFGYPLTSGIRFRAGGVLHYKMANTMNAQATMSAVTSRAMDDASAEVVMEEAVVLERSMNSEDDIEEVELRPVEMPLAFFKPNIITNDSGELNIDFTVPNFNTIWQLQILGYDSLLNIGSVLMDAVATKPVMTKLNLPQYFRTGDRGEITVSFYNNSENDKIIEGKIELFNPLTGEILKGEKLEGVNVKPSDHCLQSCEIDIPMNAQTVGVRAYAFSGNYSDGEQGIIPIYPSSTPVIDSQTFFLNSSQEKIEISLPKFDENANVTLKYNNNPIWEVLLSLPVLRSGDKSALSSAKSLYATLIGRDIILKNPKIAEKLKKILTSEDSTLTVSNLQKDENLKLMSLEMTPWVNDAYAETLRIRNLGYLLDQAEIESDISDDLKSLKALQNSDGGFSWFEGMKSSPFISSEIIGILGWLNERDLLDSELKNIGTKSVKYYDNWLIAFKKKYIKLDYAGVLNYLYNRSGFDISMSGEMKKIKSECINYINKDWKHFSLLQKSKSAIILWKLSDNKVLAKEIINSLNEFTGSQHSLNDLSLMLEAFIEVSPDSKSIDKVRELLLLKKETEMWGDRFNDASLIHSIICSISDELLNDDLSSIRVGNQEIQLNESQSLIGSFTINLDPKSSSGKKILIKRTPGMPAWGGVVSQYIQPIKDVKESTVKDLAVRKSVYVIDKNGKVKTINKLQKGDKVTVSIKLNVNKDMEYVVIKDNRASCLQPLGWESGICFIDGLIAYREINAESTSFFIENLPKGEYIISCDYNVDRDGVYSLGIASAQCLYSPIEATHSAGTELIVD